jgi:response regulator RpfG family c-di-GMP phosphodiesterase
MAKNRYSALFVHNEQSFLSAFKRLFLNEQEIEIVTARNSKEALESLSRGRIDLMVADQQLEQMSGVEFLRLAKEKYPDVLRMLFVTAAEVEAAVRLVNNGELYRFLTKPWNEEELKITIKKGLEYRALERERERLSMQIKRLDGGLKQRVQQRTNQLEKAVARLKQMSEDRKRNFQDTLVLLTQIMACSNRFLGGHSKRVAELSRMTAEKLVDNQDEVEMVYFAALFHDIGLVGAPDTLFSKDPEQFTAREKEAFRKHPLIGEEIIGNVHNLKRLSVIIRSHHEDYSGGGFPDGLHTGDIPLSSRIIRIVSDYDHLCFRKGMPAGEACSFLKRGSGDLYDPRILAVFCDLTSSILQKQTSVKIVSVSSLEPGMVLDEDLFFKNGLLFLPQGSIIDSQTIKKISAFSSLLDKAKLVQVTV